MGNTSIPRLASRLFKPAATTAVGLLALIAVSAKVSESQTTPFHLLEATVDTIQGAYKTGRLTSRQLVQLYLARIDAYDKRVRTSMQSLPSTQRRSTTRTDSTSR